MQPLLTIHANENNFEYFYECMLLNQIKVYTQDQ